MIDLTVFCMVFSFGVCAGIGISEMTRWLDELDEGE